MRVNGLDAVLTVVPVPGVKPVGPYSMSKVPEEQLAENSMLAELCVTVLAARPVGVAQDAGQLAVRAKSPALLLKPLTKTR